MSKKEDINEDEKIVDETQEIQKEVVEPTAEELLQEEKDKFLRLFAEFENYKKRTTKERIELFRIKKGSFVNLPEAC